MARSEAATVEEYLGGLPADRRAVIAAVRDVVLGHLSAGYRETMNWGMICYEVPLERFADTYNGQPLMYAAIASQKNHSALYLTCVYQDPALERALRAEFERAGKKPDMGKSCIRFRSADDLPLEGIGRIIAAVTPEEMIERYVTVRGTSQKKARKRK